MNKSLSEIQNIIKANLSQGTAKVEFSEDYLQVTAESILVSFDAKTSYNHYTSTSNEDFDTYTEYFFKELDYAEFFVNDSRNVIEVEATESELEDFCESILSAINDVTPTILHFDELVEAMTYTGCKELKVENID